MWHALYYTLCHVAPTLFSIPLAVVCEYRACLQRRMSPEQEECAQESPALQGAGGRGLLDSTPAPTPTEVSASPLAGVCFVPVEAPYLVLTDLFMKHRF